MGAGAGKNKIVAVDLVEKQPVRLDVAIAVSAPIAQKKAAAARRQRCEFRNDRHALALKRGAAGKVAGQFRSEGFSAGEDRACSGRVPRLFASPVPCRARYAFGKPRLLCGPSRADAVRPSPTL